MRIICGDCGAWVKRRGNSQKFCKPCSKGRIFVRKKGYRKKYRKAYSRDPDKDSDSIRTAWL